MEILEPCWGSVLLNIATREGKPFLGILKYQKKKKKVERKRTILPQVRLFEFLLLMRHLSSKRMLTEKTQPTLIDCCFPSPSTWHPPPENPLSHLFHLIYRWRLLIRSLKPPNLLLMNLQGITVLHLQLETELLARSFVIR